MSKTPPNKLPDTIDTSTSTPAHYTASALAAVDAAHTELAASVNELARCHGVRAAARLLGISPMSVSRWRHGDTPGRDAMRRARQHAADQGAF